MKIVTIRDILKKENHLFYRNDYTGVLVYEVGQGKTKDQPLEFSVERSAIGDIDVKVSLPENFDYPLIPAIRSLKEYISDIDKKGNLL